MLNNSLLSGAEQKLGSSLWYSSLRVQCPGGFESQGPKQELNAPQTSANPMQTSQGI